MEAIEGLTTNKSSGMIKEATIYTVNWPRPTFGKFLKYQVPCDDSESSSVGGDA